MEPEPQKKYQCKSNEYLNNTSKARE